MGCARAELLGARETAAVTVAATRAPGQVAAIPVIVIPCYNEQHRLDGDGMRRLAATERVHLVFVDDGSLDGTKGVLAELAISAARMEVIHLPGNMGKGEAVRRGLQHAIRSGAETVGYLDADLSTPPAELLRLVDTLAHRPDLEVALGCRIARLGATIDRTARRHVLGRVFATAASVALGCRVYDTQCGAKVFRVTPALVEAVERPFHSAWAFDVELLGRLLTGAPTAPPVATRAMVEVPLETWTEMGGSRLRPVAMATAFADVLRMGATRQRPRLHRARDNGLARRWDGRP